MNEDILTTASCYLDGELNEAERHAAEIDPAVMAEVARMRAVQQAMGEVSSPASPSEIDDRITAAFTAARSTTPAPSDVTTSATPDQPLGGRGTARSSQRSRDIRFGRYLGIAAAIVSLGVVGIVITQSLGDAESGDMAGSSAATTTASAEGTVADAMPAPAATLPAGGADESREDSAAEMADDTMAADMAEDTMAEAATGSSSVAAGDGSSGAGEMILVGPDRLREFTELLLTEVPAGQLPLPADDEVDCEAVDADGNPLTVIASAIYEDPDDQVTTPVLIAVRIDASTTPRRFVVNALDRVDCSVVVFTEGTLAG